MLLFLLVNTTSVFKCGLLQTCKAILGLVLCSLELSIFEYTLLFMNRYWSFVITTHMRSLNIVEVYYKIQHKFSLRDILYSVIVQVFFFKDTVYSFSDSIFPRISIF